MIVVDLPLASSARDYAWLKSSVAAWLHRTDLDSVIPDFVMLAERRINGVLRAQAQTIETMLTLTSGVDTVDLPDDVFEIRSTKIGVYGPLKYVTPGQMDNLYVGGTVSRPTHYTVSGSFVRVAPVPDVNYNLRVTYSAKVPALADTSNGVNWLIERNPDVYLAATMCEALSYTKDGPALEVWEGKFRAAIEALNNREWSNAGPLAVRADSQTP